jgi:hypothetical protein
MNKSNNEHGKSTSIKPKDNKTLPTKMDRTKCTIKQAQKATCHAFSNPHQMDMAPHKLRMHRQRGLLTENCEQANNHSI